MEQARDALSLAGLARRDLALEWFPVLVSPRGSAQLAASGVGRCPGAQKNP